MKRSNNEPKPDTTPFFEYYIADPITGLVDELVDAVQTAWRWLNDMWWCDYCKEYHGRRVHKFKIEKRVGMHRIKPGVFSEYRDVWVCSLYAESLKWDSTSSPLDDLQDAKAKIDAQARACKQLAHMAVDAAKGITAARQQRRQFVWCKDIPKSGVKSVDTDEQ